MATLNEQIFDIVTLRSLVLERVKNGLSKDVALAYKSIFDDIIKRIQNKDYVDVSNVNKIIAEVRDRFKPELNLYTELDDLAVTEASFITASINAVAGIKVFEKLPSDDILKIVARTSLFNGYTAKQTMSSFTDGQMKIIEGEIRQAIYQGETIQQIKDRLISKAGVAQNQASTLAKTFTSTVVNNVRDEVYKENEDVIKYYKHLSVFDTRTSDICLARSDKTWDVNKKPINHNLQFITPPLHMNCRSIIIPIVKSYKELGIDLEQAPEGTKSSIDGQIPANTTMTQWLKSKDASIVEKTLGKGRAGLFLDGKITLTQLVSQNGETLTIKQLKSLH